MSRGHEGHELRTTSQFHRGSEKAAADGAEQNARCDGRKAPMIAQNAVNAINQLGTPMPSSKRKRFGAVFKAALGEIGQAGGVCARGLGDANDAFIAGHFAFFRQAAFDPPERRV